MAAAKVKKYLVKHMELAKQSQVPDPAQLGSLSQGIKLYPLIVPFVMCTLLLKKAVSRGCILKMCSPISKQFGILGRWDSACSCLPLLYKCAHCDLAIPYTSCDVQHSS